MGEVAEFPRRGTVFTAPAPIHDNHDCSSFDCGKVALNDWLKLKARKSEGHSARTFVVIDQGTNKVVAYYCISVGGVSSDEAPRKVKRNMPNPVPVAVIGRLAVDKAYHGKGFGGGLFKDAIMRVLSIHEQIGFRAVIVHAKDDESKAFYVRYGMQAFPAETRTLFLPVETALEAIR